MENNVQETKEAKLKKLNKYLKKQSKKFNIYFNKNKTIYKLTFTKHPYTFTSLFNKWEQLEKAFNDNENLSAYGISNDVFDVMAKELGIKDEAIIFKLDSEPFVQFIRQSKVDGIKSNRDES